MKMQSLPLLVLVLALFILAPHGHRAEARVVPTRSLQDAAAVAPYDMMLVSAMGAPEEAPEEEEEEEDDEEDDEDPSEEEDEDEDEEDADEDDEEEDEDEEEGEDEEPMCGEECQFIPKAVHMMNPRCTGCP